MEITVTPGTHLDERITKTHLRFDEILEAELFCVNYK